MSDYIVKGGPKGAPLIGSIKDIKGDPIHFVKDNSLKYGDIIPFNVMGGKVFQLNHPDLILHVFKKNNKNYVKGSNHIRFEPVLGKGLFTSQGEKWKRDRKKIQPMFRADQINGYYFDVVKEVSLKYRKRWLEFIEKDVNPINISNELSSLTTEIILKVIFGKGNLNDEQVLSMHNSYNYLIGYVRKQRLLPKVDFCRVFGTSKYKLFRKEINNVESIIYDLLQKYKNKKVHDKYNMLSLLIEAMKNDPDNWSEKDIRDHAITMIFAGFETTSVLMQWIWYALDKNPEVQKKLLNEVVTKVPKSLTDDVDSLSVGDVKDLPYLEVVLNETMRMYPSFWATLRTPLNDDYLGNIKIPAKSTIMLPQIAMHNNPRWWDSPDKFIPERFFDLDISEMEGVFFPFSHGGRKCSGYRFAEMEAKVIFVILGSVFKVDILNKTSDDIAAGVSLKSKNPFIARITRRNNENKEPCANQAERYAV